MDVEANYLACHEIKPKNVIALKITHDELVLRTNTELHIINWFTGISSGVWRLPQPPECTFSFNRHVLKLYRETIYYLHKPVCIFEFFASSSYSTNRNNLNKKSKVR